MEQQPSSDAGAHQHGCELGDDCSVRQHLIDTAIECFGQNGYEGTTLEAIALEGALSITDIHMHWPDKLSLFLSAIETSASRRATALVDQIAMPPEQKLSLLGANLVLPNRDGHRGLILEACQQGRHSPAVRARLRDFLTAERGTLASMIEAGKASDVIDPSLTTDSLVVACLSFSLGTNLVLSVGEPELSRPSRAEWDRLVVRIMRALAPITMPSDPSVPS